MANSLAIGIDLGAIYSCVAVFQHGEVEIIANDQGNRRTPSYVGFTDVERLVGNAAKNQMALNPENTVFNAKCLIGRKYADKSVQDDMKHFSFNVINDGGKPNVKVEFRGETKKYTPETIVSMILIKMKNIAEVYLGEKVTDAVITVPAYFNDSRRLATKDAGIIAGLNVLRIINEPTAAAIAYGLDKNSINKKNVLVFDMNSTTFDVTLLTIKNGVSKIKFTSTDTHPCDNDFDSQMVDFFADDFRQKHKKNLTGDKKALRRLRTACETAKRTLFSMTQTSIDIISLFDGINYQAQINRARFDELCTDLFHQTLHSVEKALKGAKMDKAEIDNIVLVGGSTRIPKIQRLLQEFFNGHELNGSINPEEVVATGAAIYAAILNGTRNDSIQYLIPVYFTPLSLGLKTEGGQIITLIPRNTAIPVQKTKMFNTTVADQTRVIVQIYEGERAFAQENYLLKSFPFDIDSTKSTQLGQIEITFAIDATGTLVVTAKDVATGKKRKTSFENYINYRSKELQIKNIENAKLCKTADKQCMQILNATLYLKQYIYTFQTVIQTYLRLKDSQNNAKMIVQFLKQHIFKNCDFTFTENIFSYESFIQIIRMQSMFNSDNLNYEKFQSDESKNILKAIQTNNAFKLFSNYSSNPDLCTYFCGDLTVKLFNRLITGKQCDITISVCGAKFVAHKIIVSLASVEFEKLVDSSGEKQIEINDITPQAFEVLLIFMYTGELIQLEKYAIELLAVSIKYKMDFVESACEQTIITSLNAENVCGFTEIALLFNYNSIKLECVKYIKKEHKQIFKTQGWKDLQAHRPQLVIEILQSLVDNF